MAQLQKPLEAHTDFIVSVHWDSIVCALVLLALVGLAAVVTVLLYGRGQLDSEQRGVAIGMASAFLTAVAMLALAAIFAGARIAASASMEFRLEILAASLIAPATSLFICIARLAKHRFFTPEDINGSALTEGTSRAKLLQSLLQNTLEQVALALPVYFICASIFPSHLLGLIPAAGAMFFVGRILFYVGYSGGAHSRAFGFAFTFYPTVVLGFIAVYHLVVRGAA